MKEITIISSGIENAIRCLDAVRAGELSLPSPPVCAFRSEASEVLGRIAESFLECRTVLEVLYRDTGQFLSGAEQAFRSADEVSAGAMADDS